MGHHHSPVDARSANRRRISLVLALVLVYMGAEVVGGWLTGSLALLADAGHMLSDAAALGLSLFAIWAAQRPATSQHTYGYYRMEILAALINAAALVAIAFLIFVEAYERLREPREVAGAGMLLVATGGLVVNLVGLRVLEGGKSESLNVKGAWLHVLGDTLGSLGTILAGALVWGFSWSWADPAVSIVIGLLVLFSSWHLMREAVAVLMEGAPGNIDVDAVREALQGVEGVGSVHDLHVWTITSGMVAVSAHVETTDERLYAELLAELQEILHERFSIDHSTIQIEPENPARRRMPV